MSGKSMRKNGRRALYCSCRREIISRGGMVCVDRMQPRIRIRCSFCGRDWDAEYALEVREECDFPLLTEQGEKIWQGEFLKRFAAPYGSAGNLLH